MWRTIKDGFADLFGESGDIANSVELAIEDRLVSPFYGYFIFAWIIFNWDFLYTAFFVDQDLLFQKTSLLRSEYILQSILPSYHSLNWLLTFIFYPFILTVLFFWVMPVVTQPFYIKSIRIKKNLERIKLKELTANKLEEAKLINAEIQIHRAEKEAEKVSPETVWEREYDKFKSTIYYDKFNEIIQSVYEHKGLIRNYDYETDEFGEAIDSELIFRVSQDILVYADSNNLIEINNVEQRLKLTPKGKYFVKLYNFDKNKRIPF